VRNQDQWAPSKFVYEKGRLIASRDRRELVRTRLGRRTSRRTSAKFPLGYFLVAAKPAAA